MHRALEATGTTNGIAAGPEWNSAQHAKTFAPENYEGVDDDADNDDHGGDDDAHHDDEDDEDDEDDMMLTSMKTMRMLTPMRTMRMLTTI